MKRLLLTVYLFLLGVALFAQIPQTELKALTDLYLSTNGDQWNKSWDMDKDPSTWEGITITNGHVSEIQMLFNNLEGKIPSSLSNLSELRIIELSFNKLSGALPASLGNLSNLQVLALNGNFITGSIPDSFGSLANLKQLHLSSNKLSGAVPKSINKLDNLIVFNVFQNQLTGDIPMALSRNRNIREFVVAENNFNPTREASTVLLRNSAQIDLNNSTMYSTGKPVIAIEVEDQN